MPRESPEAHLLAVDKKQAFLEACIPEKAAKWTRTFPQQTEGGRDWLWENALKPAVTD